ncbi:hypothetical protein [Cellulosimicrobium sp. TH-20]|uniref:Gp37-like protein n=1 Tax=Cellulosimicrobium sp. TH-20 TaxID=1980001 RepID=UPI0011A02A81|nr:hypothetical protein [Cellulosimicrobium sp. TH-20]
MLVEDLTLEVRDPQLRRAGIVDLNDAVLEIRSEFCNVGTWKLTVVSDHPTIKTLRTPGSGITLRAHGKVFFSGRHDGRTAKATFDDPEGTVTFEGISDDHILGDRLAYPVPSSPTMEGQTAAANDVREGKLETVMHSFVRANVGPGAPAVRRHPQLDMGPDLGRGPAVKRSTRFAKLGNLLRDIVVLGDLGFRVIQRGTRLAFETYAVTDRTKTIRMDVWNGTLESYESTSVGASVTHVIVAGQDEGVKRQLLERTSAESLAQEKLWNRRIELFLDQRHTDDLEELAQAGDEELAKNGVAQSAVKFVPMDDGTMEFLKDWFVGDRVTAVVEDREVPAIVSAAVLRVDQDGVQIMCALGDINGQSSTEGFISRTESRLSALERTAESAKLVPAENVVGLAELELALRFQNGLTGGGQRTVLLDPSKGFTVRWSTRFLATCLGTGPEIPRGFFEIVAPPTGTQIPIVGRSDTVTVTDEGINLRTYDALYYELPFGGDTASRPGNFRIVRYDGAPARVAPSWVLVAAGAGDTASTRCVRWGTGDVQHPWTLIAPRLTAEWSPYVTAVAPAYRLTPDGLELRGLVRPAQTLALTTNSPRNFATGMPDTGVSFYAATIAQTTFAEVHTNGSGNLALRMKQDISAGTSWWFSLDNIRIPYS